MDLGTMRAIIYLSDHTRFLSNPEIRQLLSQARRNNESLKITGLLVHCGSNFMQYIEGPDKAVEALYRKIQRDSRHKNLRTLLNKPVAKREFESWSMAFSQANEVFFSSLSDASWLTKDRSVSEGHQALRQFWQQTVLQKHSPETG